jgi:hypothetical protein
MFRPGWDWTQDVVHTQRGTSHLALTAGWMVQRWREKLVFRPHPCFYLVPDAGYCDTFCGFFSVPPRRLLGSACQCHLSSVVLPHTPHIFRFWQAIMAQRGVKVWLYSFFNLYARCGGVVNATPWSLYPREKPGTHCIRGWVGPRAGLDGCGKPRLAPGLDPRTVQPVASRYTDWAIAARFSDSDRIVKWNLKKDKLLAYNLKSWKTFRWLSCVGDFTPCSLLGMFRRFGRTYCLRLQGDWFGSCVCWGDWVKISISHVEILRSPDPIHSFKERGSMFFLNVEANEAHYMV